MKNIRNNDNNQILSTLDFINKEFLIKKKFFLFIIVGLSVIGVAFVIYNISKKVITIKQNVDIVKLKKLDMNVDAKNAIITYFLRDKEKFILYGKKLENTIKNQNLLNDCIIKTPHIRGKIYKGPTKIIELTGAELNIPFYTKLINGKNYIEFTELKGDISDILTSKKPFQVYDDDMYLSGDNVILKPNTNYIKITKKPHLIIDNEYKTHINDKNYSYKNSTNFYDLKAKIFEVFGDEGLFLADKNVVLTRKNDIIKSQHLKATVEKNTNKIDYIFLSKDVLIQNKDSEIVADYGFFQANKNMVVFYKNVIAKTKTQKTNGDFYIYNTQNENGSTFNQYTILSKQEQGEFYNLLEHLKKHLSKDEEEYIDFVIKSNKEYIKKYNSNKKQKKTERVVLDRSKKVRAKISND